MNRRSFLAGVPAVPLAFLLPPMHEVRQALMIDSTIPVHVIVSAQASERDAEAFRRRWIASPFESEGEWYLRDSEKRDLPPELARMPGTLTYHTTVMGVAAEERAFLVGAFRREHIAIVVRIIGEEPSLMLALANHIAAQPVPDVFSTMLSDTPLYRFIPESDDLGMDVQPGDGFWP